MTKPFKQSKKRSFRHRPKKPLRGKVPASDDYDDELRKIDCPDPTSFGYDSDYSGAPSTSSSRCFPGMRGLRMITGGVAGPSSTSSSSSSPRTEPPSPTPTVVEDIVPESLPADTVGVKYSLRSSIGDGSARQADGPTIMERRDLHPNGCHVKVSHWSEEGMRSYMEDRYAIEELGSILISANDRLPPCPMTETDSAERTNCNREYTKRERKISLPLSWIGVFDGHGGEKASQFCCDQLSAYVRNQHEFPWDLGTAMKRAYRMIDEDFTRTGLPDGSTACSCIIAGNERIICANAGDSRAIILQKNGNVAKLSRDHKPGVPSETKRITDLGGKVVYWGRWRVESILAVSRSIGDAALKPYITADPDICEYDIGPDDLFLVIASDGVWDVLDNDEVARFVITETCYQERGEILCNSDKLKWTARKLCQKAGNSGSTDNLCAIVIDLQSYKRRR